MATKKKSGVSKITVSAPLRDDLILPLATLIGFEELPDITNPDWKPSTPASLKVKALAYIESKAQESLVDYFAPYFIKLNISQIEAEKEIQIKTIEEQVKQSVKNNIQIIKL